MNHATPFDTWIASTACWELILRCCEKQIHSTRQSGWNRSQPGMDEATDLAADMWMHLRKKKENFKGKITDILVRGDKSGLQGYMKSMVHSFMLEQNRDKYYQRVRQSLSEQGSSIGYTISGLHASYGSTGEDADTILSYHDLVRQGFRPDFPKVSSKDLKKAKTILRLAEVLWKQIEEYLQIDVRIPVRELCAYIREGWPESTRYEIETEQISQAEGGEELSESDLLTMADLDNARRSIMSEEDLKAVTSMADTIALKLDDRQLLLVLCLKKYCDMPHKEIARILGLSGPSHVDYRLRKTFCALEPLLSRENGLSPEDFDQDLFDLFWKLLLNNCNDEDCYRSSQKMEC